MNILWISDSPNQATGYGTVTKHIVPRLIDKGFSVSALGLQSFGQPLDFGNYRVFPRGKDAYGADMLLSYIKTLNIDTIITLGDLKDFMYFNRLSLGKVKWIPYYPMDGVGMPLAYAQLLRKASVRIAMSRHTQRETEHAGLECEMIYHGVDTSIFKPLNKKEIREANSMHDSFVIGCVARNQLRKMIPRLLQAYSIFSSDKDDTKLLLHTTPIEETGNNLFELLDRFNLANKALISEKTSLAYGVNDNTLSSIYNLFDVHALATCFHPKTFVQTEKGVKYIDDIQENEKVLTKLGTYERVKKINAFDYSGEVLEIKADGLPLITCTPNHRMFFIERRLKGSYGKNKTLLNKKIVEKEARHIKKGDFVLFPIPRKDKEIEYLDVNCTNYIKRGRNQFGSTFDHPNVHGLPTKVKLDKEFGLLVGWFLSEGCVTKDGIALCFHTKEEKVYSLLDKIIKRLFLKTTTRIRHNSRNRTTLWVNNVALGRLFEDFFGRGAHSKKIPLWVRNAPLEFQKRLLEGVWLGDGYYYHNKRFNGNAFDLQTVSQQMAWGIFRLLVQLGFRPTISSIKRESEVWSIKLNGSQNFGDIIGIKENMPKKIKKRIYNDQTFVYYPIFKINRKKYFGIVYDLSIENEPSYVTSFAGHNSGEGFCLPVLESMACGVPNVLTDITTSRELIEGRGELAKVQAMIMGPDNIERGLVDIKDFANKLQILYDDRKKLESYSKQCVEFAAQYDWSIVIKDWVKLLESN